MSVATSLPVGSNRVQERRSQGNIVSASEPEGLLEALYELHALQKGVKLASDNSQKPSVVS